jgi:hypothetical protein
MPFPKDCLFLLPLLFYLLIPETRRDELRSGRGDTVSKNPSVLDKNGCRNEFRVPHTSQTQTKFSILQSNAGYAVFALCTALCFS